MRKEVSLQGRATRKMKLDKLEERVVAEGIFVSYKLTLVTMDCGHDREN